MKNAPETTITAENDPKNDSERNYLSLNLFPDPCMILGSDGKILDASTSCNQLMGKAREELAGKNYRDVEPLALVGKKIVDALHNNAEDFDLIVQGEKHFEVFILPFQAHDGELLVRVLFKDISTFVTLEKELLKRNRELIIINTLSSAFICSGNMDLVIENLLRKVLLVTDFGIGWLLLKEEQTFRLKTSGGISRECAKGIEDGLIDELCNDIVKIAEPVHIMESSAISKIELFQREGITFLAAVPLIYDKDPIGILFLAGRSKKEKPFDSDFAALLSLVGNHVSLILDKIKLFQETKRLSITDGLTGLFNSRYLYRQLELEIARTNRYGNSFSLILFDIDNFKRLNDTWGHQAGDDVLYELAKILQSISRETDVMVRYGGEEFIVILPNTSEEDTIFLADRIRDSVEKHVFLAGHAGGVHITLSGGVASYPLNAHDAKSLLNASDVALYSAKTAGRNRIVCFKGKINAKNIQ
jgi:diguanylate cyclase (GGDEF)-like protein